VKFELLQQARLELRAAREHYEAERPGLGREFVIEVRFVIQQILQGPLHFQRVGQSRARGAVLVRFPFKIVYIVLPDLVRVIAVAHQSRRPGYWRTRR
jgi:toxin ParE1/3/4